MQGSSRDTWKVAQLACGDGEEAVRPGRQAEQCHRRESWAHSASYEVLSISGKCEAMGREIGGSFMTL